MNKKQKLSLTLWILFLLLIVFTLNNAFNDISKLKESHPQPEGKKTLCEVFADTPNYTVEIVGGNLKYYHFENIIVSEDYLMKDCMRLESND